MSVRCATLSKSWNVLALLIVFSFFINRQLNDVLFFILFLFVVVHEIRGEKGRGVLRSIKMLGICNWLIVGWLGSTILGYALTVGIGDEQLEDILGLRWLLSLYLSIYLGERVSFGEDDIRKVSWGVVLLLLGSLILQYGSAIASSFHGAFVFERYGGVYGNASVAGATLTLVWALVLSWMSLRWQMKVKQEWTSLTLFFVLTIILFLTQSRGSWIAMGLVSLVIYFLIPVRRILLIVLGSAPLVAVLYYFNIFKLQRRILYSFDWGEGTSQGLRLNLWKSHWQMFLDHPWFGTGYYESWRLLPEYLNKLGLDNRLEGEGVYISHAHNQILQVLAGAGVVGFSFFILIFFVGIGYFFRNFSSPESSQVRKVISLCCFAVVLAFVGNWIFDCPVMIHPTRVMLLFITGMGLGMGKSFNVRTLC